MIVGRKFFVIGGERDVEVAEFFIFSFKRGVRARQIFVLRGEFGVGTFKFGVTIFESVAFGAKFFLFGFERDNFFAGHTQVFVRPLKFGLCFE